jgi:hypothetical protein
MSRKVLIVVVAFLLLFGTAVFACVQVLTVDALVPNIVSVSFREVGSDVWVDVVVSHQPPPAISSSHYVSNVQVEVNGVATDLSQSPQSTETFTVEHNLGSSADTYSVRARALCTVHGYSAFSSLVTYPEGSPTPTPSASPTPTPVATPTPTQSPEPPPLGGLSQDALYAIVIVVAVIVVVALVLIFRRR